MTDEIRAGFGRLLAGIAGELDLPPSKREDVENKYKAVADWLGKPESALARYEPEIYPHGSFQLRTVVRPLGHDEFDLDFVCRLNIAAQPGNQSDIKKMVGDRLRENGTYRSNRMIREKNRCWRLNYAGDFHMDIMPAVPDISRADDGILVSDRDLASWVPSAPRPFARWFDQQQVPFRQKYRSVFNASVEELPDQQIKTPLQVSVQILKRHRDKHFQGQPKLRPSSIVLTTLAAKAYGQQDDLLDALRAIVTGMPHQVDLSADGVPVVLNPTNPNENFAEKWQEHPERLGAFRAWLVKASQDLDELLELRGLDQIGEFLADRLGQREANAVLRAEGQAISDAHQQHRLEVTAVTGPMIVGKPREPVRPSTSYGTR